MSPKWKLGLQREVNMPELAEVYYYAKQWAAGKGKPVSRVELHAKSRVFRGCDTGELEEGLNGAALKEILTHGKQMLFKFSRGQWLAVHLGMTGETRVAPQPYEAAKHDHLVLHLRDRALIFTDPRQFGWCSTTRGTLCRSSGRRCHPKSGVMPSPLRCLLGCCNVMPGCRSRCSFSISAIFPASGTGWRTKSCGR
ncbi:DNA-formamidopyrimidine glycosylase family protein [Verrucomicrobium spinosum]|uniref:DNA-formamidopyrimidine glycosylase family protein n=1 Tax=Verrucomicrobium spinosum TaxID=2736 RepID=UPI0009EB06BA|nr:DNA-formamidopyrimidine glycosylase family protein [Verrucomicrobium spinosum]